MTEQLTERRMASLMLGNRVRFARARDKREIRRGDLGVAELLRHPPDHWKKASVFVLLTLIPHVGPSRARRWLFQERVEGSMMLGDMPETTRYRLARHVDAAAMRAARAREDEAS